MVDLVRELGSAFDVNSVASEPSELEIDAEVALAESSRQAKLPFSFPPGVAGTIARHMYASSYSPIVEVATVATVALLAGVCGRTYRTHTNVDLSLYQILVARSGIGKDAIHKEIPKWIKVNGIVGCDRFIQATDFVSGPSLHKQLLATPGFLNLQGEFGRRLSRMANPTDAPEQAFRSVLTNAYSKDYLEGKTYSDAGKNVSGVAYPALSFLGETTPGKFKEALTSDMMEDGLLSRFLVTTYEGDRPLPNENGGSRLADDQWQYWCSILSDAVQRNPPAPNPPQVRVVRMDPDALAVMSAFNIRCITTLNAKENEGERAVWTRAHLKALKLASLLAVADCYREPVATMAHVKWAIQFVMRDVNLFLAQLASGDIGNDDSDREKKVLQICLKWLQLDDNKVPTQLRPYDHLRKAGIIPRKYIQTQVSSLPAFCKHKRGSKAALDIALKSAVLNETLLEMNKLQLEPYKTNAQCFVLTNRN